MPCPMDFLFAIKQIHYAFRKTLLEKGMWFPARNPGFPANSQPTSPFNTSQGGLTGWLTKDANDRRKNDEFYLSMQYF